MSYHIEKCPWCGGSATLNSVSSAGEGAFVGCDNKDCQGNGPFLDSEEQAVEAWNRVAIKGRQW